MKKQIIYSDYEIFNDEARKEYQDFRREIEENDSYVVSDEEWSDECTSRIEDEADNLNVEVDGVIVAFASVSRWNGVHQGVKVLGSRVNEIFFPTECDLNEWFGDGNNVRSSHTHHDGSNHILYRVCKDRDAADRLADKIYNREIDEAGFRKRTKSLYPYVAEVYGWKTGRFSKKKTA